MSDDKYNEGQPTPFDVIGVECFVDEVFYQLATDPSTSTAILRSFWRANAPARKMGESIVHNMLDGDHT